LSAATDTELAPRHGDVEPRPFTRQFWALWWAVGVSGLGNGVVLVAYPLLAAQLTSDARLVAGAVVAETLPNLFSLHLGVLLDRVDRRKLVVASELARAAVLLGFAALVVGGHRPPIAALYVTVFFIGLGQAVTTTGSQVVLREIVPSQHLGRANGWLSSVETGTELTAGQALGGVMFAAAVFLPFFVDGLTFVASALLLLVALPVVHRERVTRPTTIHADLAEGVRAFRQDATLRALAALISSYAFCQALVFGALVLFVERRVGLSEQIYGVTLGVAALGAVLGGIFAGRIEARLKADLALLGFGGLIVSTYLAMAVFPIAPVVVVALFCNAFLTCVSNVASITLRQRVIPADMVGRVMGLFRMLILGAFPLGALAGGFLAHSIRLETPLYMAAGLQLLAISVMGRRLSRLVRGDSRL